MIVPLLREGGVGNEGVPVLPGARETKGLEEGGEEGRWEDGSHTTYKATAHDLPILNALHIKPSIAH